MRTKVVPAPESVFETAETLQDFLEDQARKVEQEFLGGVSFIIPTSVGGGETPRSQAFVFCVSGGEMDA